MRISDWSSDVCSSDLARGDEVVEDILLLVEPPGVVPRLAIFAAAAQVRDREHAALVDPREPGRREGGGHRDVEATIAIEQRRRSLAAVEAFLHHDEHRHLGAVLRLIEAILDRELPTVESKLISEERGVRKVSVRPG